MVVAAVRRSAGAVRRGGGGVRGSESASRARAEMGAVRLSQRLQARSARRSPSPAGERTGSRASWWTSGRTGCCSRTTAAGRTWWRRRRSAAAGLAGRRLHRNRQGGAGLLTCAGCCGRLRGDHAAVQVVLDDGGSAERNAGPGRRGLRGAGGAPGGPAAPVGGAGCARSSSRRSPSNWTGRLGSARSGAGLAAGAAGSGVAASGSAAGSWGRRRPPGPRRTSAG